MSWNVASVNIGWFGCMLPAAAGMPWVGLWLLPGLGWLVMAPVMAGPREMQRYTTNRFVSGPPEPALEESHS